MRKTPHKQPKLIPKATRKGRTTATKTPKLLEGKKSQRSEQR